MSTDKKILITGAAGLVGSILRRHWGDTYPLRLADIRPVKKLRAHEEFVELDITRLDRFEAACQGIDTVVHLAADPAPSADFYKTLLNLNIIGAYNGFEAAARANCRRLVLASSINAVLGYGDRKDTPWDDPVYPINVYGATKCWGEALGRVYSHRGGLSCISVRLGSPRFQQGGDWDPDAPANAISPRDTAQLFQRCIEVEDVDCAIVPGISRHRHGVQDVEDAVRILGYQPQDGTAFERTVE